MKRLLFIIFSFLYGVCLFAQTSLTPDQIRQYANQLGVPFEALQRLVQEHSQPVPNRIVLSDPGDVSFLHRDPRIRLGNTYEVVVEAWFSSVMGTSLILTNSRTGFDGFRLGLVSRIPSFSLGTPVRVSFRYTPLSRFPEVSEFNTELISIERR